MRDCGIRRVAERQGLLLCWWMECREMIRMESLAGFQAHAPLPDLGDSFHCTYSDLPIGFVSRICVRVISAVCGAIDVGQGMTIHNTY